MRMSASISVSSNRMRTGLSPCFRCLRWRRIRCAAGVDERVGEILLMVLLDAALLLVYESPTGAVVSSAPARLGSPRQWSPPGRTVPRFHRPAEIPIIRGGDPAVRVQPWR